MRIHREPLRIPRDGEPAPNFEAVEFDGRAIALASCQKPVVLVFLRHLA